MAGQNDFLIFDENQDNMLTQANYEVDSDRTDGFRTGLARSNVNNKVLHQTSMMCHAIGEVAKDKDLVASDGGTVSDLKDTLDDIFGADKSLSNLDATGEKHFLNKNQTSNCILEMPSTSPSYNGLTITIPAGLKVLIPNGRNADGTCNNIEYTTTSNSTYTISGTGNWLIFMQANGVLWLIPKQDINNRAGYVFFDFKNNTWYDTYNGQQADAMCLIGECISNSSQITSFVIYNGLRLLNWNDKRNIVNWSQVDYSSAISLTLGGTNPYTYTAPKNGWFCLRAKMVTSGASLNISLGNEQIPFANSRTTTGGNQVSYVSAPCCAGGQVSIGWGGTLDSTDYNFYFVPLMGEENYI